jgi:hypothetical protein
MWPNGAHLCTLGVLLTYADVPYVGRALADSREIHADLGLRIIRNVRVVTDGGGHGVSRGDQRLAPRVRTWMRTRDDVVPRSIAMT